jgi:hypothetical protein
MNINIALMANRFPLLIAVSGKLGSGKDYVIEHFIMTHIVGSVTRMAFADQIKVNVASRYNVELIHCLEGQKSAELRKMLQIAGTEDGRDLYGPDIWINTLENWINLRQIRGDKLEVVLVTDCRFQNEAEWVEQHNGLLIRVNAPNRNQQALSQEANGCQKTYDSISQHASETALDSYPFKYVIQNDPKDQGVHGHVLDYLRDYCSNHDDRMNNFDVKK